MKKILFILSILIASNTSLFAQKFAYVDTDYILEQFPEYQEAQQKLNELSAKWQKEIEEMFAEVEKLKQAYKLERILLTEEMQANREAGILEKEKQAIELQKERFGINGQLFRKRQELIKPIQDKVYSAIKSVANKYGYSIIFDKSNSISMLYASKKLDKSELVLKQLGYGKTKKK